MHTRKNDYRRESPNKKKARLLELKVLEDVMGKEAFRAGPHLVIASKEAGDISAMLGMGVEPSAIHAVDIDRHALAAAKDRFGSWGVKFRNIDFRDANDKFGVSNYASAIIDLCSPLLDDDIQAVIDFKAKYKVYGFQINREQGLANVFTQSIQDGGKAIKGRLDYLAFRGFKTGLAIHYVSRTLTNKGTPMCLAFCKNVRKPSKNPEILSVTWGYADLDRQMMSTAENTWLLYNVPKMAPAAKKAWKTRNIAKVRGVPR